MKNELISTAIVLLILLSFLSLFVVTTSQAQSPLALDGSVGVGCGGVSCSMQLHVTQNDVVVVQVALSPQSVQYGHPGTPYHAGFLQSVTSPGMAFKQRYAYTTDPGSGDGSLVWEDYAIAPTTGVVTIAGAVNNSRASWDMVGYSVKGANTTAPFDTNPGVPVGDFNDCNLVDGCSITFSTTNPNTFVIAGIGSQGDLSFPPSTAPTNGFTLIVSSKTGYITDAVAYRIFSSPQTKTSTGNWVLVPGESAFWFADAIQGATTANVFSGAVSQQVTVTAAGYHDSPQVEGGVSNE